MQTTLEIDDHILRQAKAAAALRGSSLTQFVEEVLRASLTLRSGATRSKRIKLPTHSLGKPRKGVDLNNGRALRDRMDSAARTSANG